MIGNWLKRKIQIKGTKAAEEDIRRILSVLKGMSDEEVAAVLASATMLRLELQSKGILTEGIFETPDPSSSTEFGYAMNGLGKIIRDCQSSGNEAMAAGVMVWHQSLRAIAYPEITYLGQEMWQELRRGFPLAEFKWNEISLGVDESWGAFPINEIQFIPSQLARG